MVLIISVVCLKKWGLYHPTATIVNDAIIEISIMPMVPGNFKNLKLMYPNTAVKTMMRVIRL